MSTTERELVVLAGVVQLLRNVGPGYAWVDVFRGELVGDIDEETRDRLLNSKAIGWREVAGPVDEEPDDNPAEVPDGSIPAVLEWVGGDKERAQRALDVEQEKGEKARKGVIDPLTELLTAPGN